MPQDGYESVSVPLDDYEQAREYKPEGVTWGDVLVAGAERLNEHLDSGTARFGDDVNAEEFADAIRAELDTDAPDFNDIQSSVRTIEARTNRIEKTLEDMGAGR